MASGIIYLAIIGMWIAYFLPRWVHNKNEFSGKSVERYKSALRVVAGENSTSPIFADVDRAGRVAQQLMRNRILFSIIAITFIATSLGAIMGTVVVTSILIPVVAGVLYIAHVRRQAKLDALQHKRMDSLHRRTEGVSHTNLSQVVSPSTSTPEHWVPFADRELSGVTLLPKGSQEARAQWQPSEVPLPTYVTAPKAIVPKRVIDLTEPGRWSDEQEELERQALAAAAPTRDEIFDQQIADEAAARARRNRAG